MAARTLSAGVSVPRRSLPRSTALTAPPRILQSSPGHSSPRRRLGSCTHCGFGTVVPWLGGQTHLKAVNHRHARCGIQISELWRNVDVGVSDGRPQVVEWVVE